ncbi:Flagellar basal-body P-ring formation protein FlgA [Chitinispirillum alkaliphilum]|nr:Flagellar basal-body P-ring formation protein FlgA [Chitinispirillum alkaliphilum]
MVAAHKTLQNGIGWCALSIIIQMIISTHAWASNVDVMIRFNESVTVNDTLIRVGDLGDIVADDIALAEEISGKSAGQSAPPGHSRFINPEDLIIFHLQPHFENVTFFSSGHGRVRVSTDYVEAKVEDYKEKIHQFFKENVAWGDGEWELTIRNEHRSWKMFRAEAQVSFSELSSPFPRANTSIMMEIKQGNVSTRIPVSCFVTVKSTVVAAKARIERNALLSAENCTLISMDVTHLASAPIRDLAELNGKKALRTITQGTVLHDRMLRDVPLVGRGDQVMIGFSNSNIRISVMGVARESGTLGERIWVNNMQTNRPLRAEITGRGRVTVFKGEENI